MIDLDPDHLRIVRNILKAHAVGSAFAFGSRVRGSARRFSDLDIVIREDRELGLEKMGNLRWAFSESDLPMKVDVLDWSELGGGFRAIIQPDLQPI